MASKHTPWPWRVTSLGANGSPTAKGGNYWIIEAGDGGFRGSLEEDGPKAEEGLGFHASGYMAECDARLMAAAPELLAALLNLVARCDGEEGVRANGSNIDTLAAHFAIAKAEGR